MQEKNITLFAGAGFSRAVSEKIQYCGGKNLKMPLGTEMFNNKSSQDYLGGVKFLEHDYCNLGNYLLNNYGSRTPSKNYEEVYGELLKDKKDGLAHTLEKLVFEILGVNFPPVRTQCETIQTIKIIREFLSREKINQIITTNPDILLDVAIMGATEFDEKFLNLFGERTKKISEIINNPQMTPVLAKKESFFSKIEGIKRFVKIHGSITMAENSGGTCGKLYWQDKYKWHKGISSEIYTHNGQYKLCVIHPSPYKCYEGIWEILIEDAKETLRNTNKLIFYGFGFGETDTSLSQHIRDSIGGISEISVIDTHTDSFEFRKKACLFLGSSKTTFGEVKEL